MTEDELMKILLFNLNNLHCRNCGKTPQEDKDDALLGCLYIDTGDASVGLRECVYWICPECKGDAIKRDELIIGLSNLSEGRAAV
jgi:hypothetical protein